MASGVAVDPKCMLAFDDLKARKNRCIVLKINDDMTNIELEKTHPPAGSNAAADWESFLATLPQSDCRYIAYDFSYEHQGAMKNRIIFVLWSPENSKVKSKMIYASSQEGAVNKFKGVQRQLQCMDEDEIKYDQIAAALKKHTAGY